MAQPVPPVEPAPQAPPVTQSPSAESQTTQAQPVESATPGDGQAEARRKLAAHRVRKPSVVGGCGDFCEDPSMAFRGFARRLLLAPEEAGDLPALPAFLDSSELRYDGRALGAGWVLLWKAGLVAQRSQEVQAFAGELGRRTGRALDGAAFLAKLDRPLEVQRISSVDVTIVYAMPGTGTLEEGEPWTFQLGKRGLEWLVKGIKSPLAPGGTDALE